MKTYIYAKRRTSACLPGFRCTKRAIRTITQVLQKRKHLRSLIVVPHPNQKHESNIANYTL